MEKQVTKRKTGYVLMIIGAALVAMSLGIAAYNLIDERRAESSAATVMKKLSEYISEHDYTDSSDTGDDGNDSDGIDGIVTPHDYEINPNMEMPTAVIDGNKYIGYVTIEKLGIELPVMAEWSYPNLKIAPCRYNGTAYKSGFVIAAHNYERHFGLIKNLKEGDSVVFTDIDRNIFNYSVIGLEVLQPYSIEEMKIGDWDLTLFTCTIGGASRVTLRCMRDT